MLGGPLLEVEMSKKCTLLWREAHLQVKMYKTPQLRTAFGSWDVEKVHAVVARSTFPSKNAQNTPCTDHFWRLDVVSRGRRKGFCTCSKVSKTWGFCSISKNDGKHGTFEEDLQRSMFRGRRSTRDIFIRVVRRSGRWFPERGCILEHQIFRFAEMTLRDRCSTSYDLASLFRGRRGNLDRWTGKIAKRIGTRPSALHATFHFVFDVVNFEKWGSLAELLRFWRCQVQTLRTSRKISAFLMLSSSKAEDVSQNSFVFKLADRQIL